MNVQVPIDSGTGNGWVRLGGSALTDFKYDGSYSYTLRKGYVQDDLFVVEA